MRLISVAALFFVHTIKKIKSNKSIGMSFKSNELRITRKVLRISKKIVEMKQKMWAKPRSSDVANSQNFGKGKVMYIQVEHLGIGKPQL